MRTFIPGLKPRHVRCLLMAVLLSTVDLFSYAQSSLNDMRRSSLETTLPVVVMPSPNSAALTRIVNENLDMYTGRLSVDIPLYTIKGRNVELPISLQSSINAHKVNDVGSWAGMGWFLNAGGAITRVMKNLPDEHNGTISPKFNFHGVGFLRLNTAQENYVVLDRFNPVIGPYADEYEINEMKSIINRGNWNTPNSFPDKGYDLQPDEFYFNFGNYSGKFVFDQSGNVIPVTGTNLNFTYTISNNKITGFTVKTDDGYVYEFGNGLNAVEESKLTVHSQSMLFAYRYSFCRAASAIPKPDGTSEPAWLYYYERDPYVLATEQPAGHLEGPNPEPYSPTGGILDWNHPDNDNDADYPTFPSTWHLTKVTAPTGDFITLNYVSNGTLTYVADRGFSSSHPEFTGPVSSRGCTSSPNPSDPWIFSGGYFRSYAPPKNIILYSDPWFEHYPSFGDYTISSNTITLSSKRLYQIVTNNGYKVEFIANTSRPELPGDRLLDKISIQHNGVVIKEFDFGYETVQNNDPVENISIGFKFPEYVYDQLSRDFWYTRPTTSSRSMSGAFHASMRYRSFLKTVTETGGGGERVPAFQFDYFTPSALVWRTAKSQDKYGFSGIIDNPNLSSFDKMLAGVLKSITYPTGGTKEFTFEFSGTASSWNGLRIASISERESPNATAIVKNYTYGPFHAVDGAVVGYHMPDVVFGLPYQGGTWYVPVANKIINGTSRVNPENLTRGAAGGYAWVEESQAGNGKRRVEFYTSADHPDAFVPTMLVSGFNGGFIDNISASLSVSYPFPQNHSEDWKRGMPKAEHLIGADGKTRQSMIYNYDFTSNAMAPGHSLGLQVSKYRIDYGTDWNWMLYGRYSFYPKWQMLKSRTVREYASDGVSYRETIQEDTYDKIDYLSKQYLFLRETKLLSDSKNEQNVQRFKYTLDYVGSAEPFGWGIAQLRNKNVFNAVVEQYQYKQNPDGSNKRYLSGTLNKYHELQPVPLQTFSLQPASPLTSFTESTNGASTFTYDPNYKPVLNFTRYNTYGSIEEQYKESDIKESYIWDGTNTYPIAKVTNAGYNEVAYTSFEDGNFGNWSIGGSVLSTEYSFMGKRSYSAGMNMSKSGLDPNKTYVVSYWVRLPFTTVNVNGTVESSFSGPQVNGWEYQEKKVKGVSTLVLTGDYLDEVRLHPANAQMTTYMYDPKVGITAMSDQNNRIIKYEYDGLQRLKVIKDINGNIIKTFDYNYKEAGTAPMWANTAEKRCEPCSQNGNYHTANQQVKQINVNPNSPNYKEERWFDLGNTGACPVQQDWQIISGPVCLTNGSGYNTGIQRFIQKNMNPCSPEPLATRNYDVPNPTACPSNEPVWQATEEYRCRPCATPPYISKWQERKWIDINPNSNRPFEWRETGAFCSVPADYQPTGATRCQLDGIGLPTGVTEREMRDVNPCSDSYGNTVWWNKEPSTCQPVYLYITRGDYKYNNGIITEDIYISAWHNQAGTIPATLTNFQFTIEQENQSSCPSDWFYHNFTLNGSSMKLFDDVATEFENTGAGCYYYVQFNVKYP